MPRRGWTKGLARNETFDLVLLDARVPGGDWDDDSSRLHWFGTTPDLPLVLVTTMSHRRRRGDLERAGLAAVLTKPIKRADLAGCLEAVAAGVSWPPRAPVQPPGTTPLGTVPSRTDRRILLVEDNVVNQKLALHVVRQAGYACDLAEQHYDLVLMDCQMPVMDGFAATAAIREREAGGSTRLPVIAMTANAMSGDRQRCLDAGMDDYISKPFDMRQLVALLDSWVTSQRVG